jgi:hypothetical protein
MPFLSRKGRMSRGASRVSFKLKPFLDSKEMYEGASYSQISRVPTLAQLLITDTLISNTRFSDSSFMRGLDKEKRESVRIGIANQIYEQ